MNNLKVLEVWMENKIVGRLALANRYAVAFEYDEQWLLEGYSISPFSLPLKKGVCIPKDELCFRGLFGVFDDSLSDGWGRLLVDRMLLKHHYNPVQVSCLDRLAIVGNNGMGALSYQPILPLYETYETIDYDILARECERILGEKDSDELDALYALGGTSGGARPKILTKIDDEDWLIKFASIEDGKHIGRQEYEYSLCAKECGIQMSETRLFPSTICDGYFGIKRFDRYIDKAGNKRKRHMISVGALLETSHRIPNLEYATLLKLTQVLCDDFEQVENMYRLMCFNVFAHNRDDHAKNFSFLYDEEKQAWVLSPAYDLTYSNSIGGQHATTIHGNGLNPVMNDILEVAYTASIAKERARNIALHVQICVEKMLKEWL